MALLKAIEEVLIKIASAILNLIDKHYSVEVENGDDAENGDLIEEVLIKRMIVRSLAETISPRMTVRSSSRGPQRQSHRRGPHQDPGDLTVVGLY
nr:hypothetical protein CFP56_64655 [Quercus suber]